MLCDIGREPVEEAQPILTLLCFSSRPMSGMEIIEAIAVDIHDQHRHDCDRRLENCEDLLRIYPGLIDIDVKPAVRHYRRIRFSGDVSADVEMVRIAHFSVQEYLLSDRIKQGRAAGFAMSAAIGHLQISKVCLSYLCNEGSPSQSLGVDYDTQLSFARYAAHFWHHHWRQPTHIDMMAELGTWIKALLSVQNNFYRWIQLDDIDGREWTWDEKDDLDCDEVEVPYHYNQKRKRGSYVYYASLLGLDNILSSCLSYPEADANARGGSLGTALCAASKCGHENMVQMLIDAGAEVNAQTKWHRKNALQAASEDGHEKVVQMLLEAGADINAQEGELTALEAASESGHEQVVQMLIGAGADVNAQSSILRTALQLASFFGYEKVVQILLDAGAEVNAQGGFYGNALNDAAYEGNEKVVEMLLHAGADVNAQGGQYGSALQVARRGRRKRSTGKDKYERVIQILLDAGAIDHGQNSDDDGGDVSSSK